MRASCIPVGTLGIWKRSKGSALSIWQVTLSSRSHDWGGGQHKPGSQAPWKHLIPFARVFFTMDSAGTMNIALKSCLDDAFHRDIQLSFIAAVTSTSEDGSEPRRGKRTVSRFSQQTGLKKTHFTGGGGGAEDQGPVEGLKVHSKEVIYQAKAQERP